MQISLNQISKKFNHYTLFENLSTHFKLGEKWVIKGTNGSGKSTLLQILAGLALPSSGEANYLEKGNKLDIESWHNYYAICAPSIDLLEDFSPLEFFKHHFSFKSLHPETSIKALLNSINLFEKRNHKIGSFSSGMKQRIKLASAIATDSKLLFLDEPINNLDHLGIDLYKELISTFGQEKTVVVCSNQVEDEYYFCQHELDIMKYKP